MRETIIQNPKLVERNISHIHAEELKQISKTLKESKEILNLVYNDLVRGIKNPKKGRKGLSADLTLRALIIKQLSGYSYEELAFHLTDSTSYKNFCSIGFTEEAPKKTALNNSIKKIKHKTLEKINQILVRKAFEEGIESGKKTRTDCTVVESNIHYPTDSSLLWDSVRVLTRLMTRAKEVGINMMWADHTLRAKRRCLSILNSKGETHRKKNYKDLIKIAKKTVISAKQMSEKLDNYASSSLESMLLSLSIKSELLRYIPLAEKVIDQSIRRVLDGEKVSSEEKIVSIFEAHTDIIVKKRRETEFGHKISLTGGASGLIIDVNVEEGNPADSSLAVDMVARQEKIYGKAPTQISMDGGFASIDNLKKIKAMKVKDVAFHKKRGLKISEMVKSSWVYKKLRNFRAGIEGMISFLKRSFGLDRCNWRGFESFKSYVYSSVISANLLIMARNQLK